MSQSIFTDGESVWDGTLVYYVTWYSLSPGEEFLNKAKQRSGLAPTVTDDQAHQAKLLVGGIK